MPRHSQSDLAALLLAKAIADLEALEALVDTEVADGILGFHAQQAVEKSLKATLAECGVEYERTHDLDYLVELLSETELPAPPHADELGALTQWAVRFRYEVEVPELDRGHALALTRKICEWARGLIAKR